MALAHMFLGRTSEAAAVGRVKEAPGAARSGFTDLRFLHGYLSDAGTKAILRGERPG